MSISACGGFAGSDSGADTFILGGVVITGAVHWVDSVNGNDANSGTEALPLATLAQAIANATANNGDIIVIKSGHTETLLASVTINKAGLRIFGIGNGTAAPSFIVGAAIDGLNITADDVEINNLYFPAGTTTPNSSRINVDADRVIIKNCRFNCGVNDANTITLTANATNFLGRSISMTVTADGPDAGILVEAAVSGFHLEVCSFNGATPNWDNAAVYSTAALVNYRLESVTLTGAAGIAFTSGSAKGQMGDLIEGDGSQVQA